MSKQFFIDEKFICDEHVYREWGIFDNIPRDQLTDEQLIVILKGKDRCSSSFTRDHPEFTKLRDQLEQEGYIKTERSWCNGDRVLKPFMLNEWKFKKGHQFSCAVAMKVSITIARKSGRNTLSTY